MTTFSNLILTPPLATYNQATLLDCLGLLKFWKLCLFGILDCTFALINMLRLLPSEIAITPEDIRTVNERLDQQKRARAKVKLHPGPERSRDRAVTSLIDRGVLSYQAELSDEHDAVNYEQIRSAQARARIGLPPAGSQLRSPSEILASRQQPESLRHLAAASTTSMGHTGFAPLRAQLDGFVDTGPALSLEAGDQALRHRSSSAQLLQARALSAPSIPRVALQGPTPPRPHSRLPMSDGAIAFDAAQSGSSEATGQGARFQESAESSIRPLQSSHAPRLNAGPLRYPVAPPSSSSPLTVRMMSHTSLHRSEQNSSDASPSSEASSSSSSAAEAAADDRPSPLESISQQAAMAHSRLTAQTRRRPLRPAPPGLPVDHLQSRARTNRRTAKPSSDSDASRDNFSEDVANALGLPRHHVARAAFNHDGSSDQNSDVRTSTSALRTSTSRASRAAPMRHQPLLIRSGTRLHDPSSSSSARQEPLTRHPIPPRYSSRTIPFTWLIIS